MGKIQTTRLSVKGHFDFQKFTFKTRLSAKPFCENEFYLHENKKNHFHIYGFTSRSETEAYGNSEMAQTFILLLFWKKVRIS